MDSVLVVIAAPGSGAIGDAVLSELAAHGAGAPRWLKPGEALEVDGFPGLAAAQAALRRHALDCVVVARGNRRKRLLVADMDSTMIAQECIDELGAMAGLKEPIAAITVRAMRGEIDFEQALDARVALLGGLPVAAIDTVLASRITPMAGAETLIATMKAHGAYTALVSGGFTHFTRVVSARLGFDHHEANTLLTEGGRLTGRVAKPVLGADAKLAALRRLTVAQGLGEDDSLAVGDGANDIPMITAAGLGVALHAKPQVRAAARASISHGDLTALLYLQGYAETEFVRR